MSNSTEYILNQWNVLKAKLKQRGIEINDTGATNDIILTLSTCFYKGTEIRERSGKRIALDNLQEKITDYRDETMIDVWEDFK
jgi:hypothetical protein